MAAKNDITGDAIRSKTSNKKYADGWERIFGKKKTTGESSKGRTTDFDSVNRGSNPCSPAND
jgi:hypothetical protein